MGNERDTALSRDPMPIGMKREDYVSPERVVGAQIDPKDMPDDIKFFLKQGRTPPNGIPKRVEIYEVFKDPSGIKERLDHVDTIMDRLPEPEELALNYGPADIGYKWIAKWLTPSGERVGIESPVIRVSEKWRGRYEAYQAKLRAAEAAVASPNAAPAPAAAAAAAAVPASGVMGPMEMLAFMREGEERAIKMMERMAGVLKSVEGPSAVMEKAYDAVGRFMEKSMESNMAVAKKVADNAREQMELPPEDEDDEPGDTDATPAPAQDGMPVWLKPIMDKAADGLAHLLGGGPTGAVVKSLILSSAEWKEIFSDKEKFSTMTQALREEYGDEKVEKALAVLLNKRPEKPVKKKGGK